VQEAARKITEAQRTSGSFDVQVVFWEDIVLYLAEHPDIVKKHYPQLGVEDRSSRRALREDYLRGEWARLIPVPLLGLVGSGRRQEEIPLSAVYTALDVTATIRVGEKGAYGLHEGFGEIDSIGLRGDEEYLKRLRTSVRREASERSETNPRLGREQGYGRRFTAVEATAAAPRLVLLGPGGSGKSTFARHLSLCLAGETLGRPEANLARLNGRPKPETRVLVTSRPYAYQEGSPYTSKWRRCWTKAGWKWKGERRRPEDEGAAEEFLLPNHPRVIVTWYEAYAFSRWLSEKLGYDVRLPSEAEWEKAARGGDGRAYPWGEEFDAARCNIGDTGIGMTSAVGAFPSGSSPYGVLDMSGNVWEWCATKWRKSYEEPATEDPEGEASRVARGGSFADDRDAARCAFRGPHPPLVADANLGFRVSAPIL